MQDENVRELQVRGAQALGRGGVLVVRRSFTGRSATPQMDSLRSRLGFTLLELIISISMLVIIIVIISGAMRLASRSIAAGERKVETLERLRTSLSIINAQIQSGMPLMYSDQGALGTQGATEYQGAQSTQSTQGVRQGAQGTQQVPRVYRVRSRRLYRVRRVRRVYRVLWARRNLISRVTGDPYSFRPTTQSGVGRRAM